MPLSNGAATLGDLIAPERRMSITALARELGISHQAIRMWLLGVSTPTPDHREALKRILNIPVSAWDETARASPTVDNPSNQRVDNDVTEQPPGEPGRAHPDAVDVEANDAPAPRRRRARKVA